MKKINIIGLVGLSVVLAGGALAASLPFLMDDTIAINENNPYQINITGKTCSLPTTGYKDQEFTFTQKTKRGTTIEFGYLNGLKSKDNVGQFQNKGKGCVYNKTAIHFIDSITINYSSQTNLEICVGDHENPQQNFIPVSSGISIPLGGNHAYFTIRTTERYAVIKSIDIQFNCNNSQLPDLPSSSEDGSSHIDGGKKLLTINAWSLSDGIIPTSYTPSGVKFVSEDIHFFANYITKDYAGGASGKNSKQDSKDFFVLRENKGYLMNTNPINGLSKISFNNTLNPTSFDIYVSKEFDKNWVKVNHNSTNIDLPSGYSYFKITSKEKLFAFKELSITYENTLDQINEIYNIKDIAPLTNKSEADALVSVTSEHFVNTSYWINQGYASDMQTAKAEAANKKQSGYEGHADYQIEFNQDVVMDKTYKSYRVADLSYGDNGNSFRINMLDPSKEGPVIYKDCAYTYIEDIAAYITAFGDVPPNMRYKADDASRAIADWGINGRANYTAYSNDNSGRFKFETENSTHRYFFNPSENSNDYWYNYYENDYGADVGNDEPYQNTTRYSTSKYNNGSEITRGALRFVWTYSFTNSEHSPRKTVDITNGYDRNVFFTNTHYNDFQQYLNYYGGWSLRFGNTTLGNGWNKYNRNRHQHSSPEVTLVSLKDLQK